jgi:TorA specific chaperone
MDDPHPITNAAGELPAAFVYRWVAGLFLAPPTADALASYQSEEGQNLLSALAAVPAMASPVADLRALTVPGRDLTEAASRLASAYSAAFLVGGRRSAPPYASVWLSPNGLMYQEPARDMTRMLAALELTLPANMPEPPDHIGFQLNLLAELDERARAGVAVPITPDAFIREHMLDWVPLFARACAGLRNPYFFADLASGLSTYLSEKA